MKKLVLLIPFFAAVALFAQTAFADDTHRHEEYAQEAPGETAMPEKMMNGPESMLLESMEKMRAQMAEINRVKDSKKRRKLLQEHNQSMRDSIKMMREMMDGMAMGHKMGEHKMCDQKMGGHKMDGNPVAKPDSSTDAAPAAQANPNPAAATGKTSASPEKKLWTCPMHPDVVRDQPGSCPICGMDLVEMDTSGASQPEHSHTMGGRMMEDDMKCDCMKGDGMKSGHMMGGAMKEGGMMEGGMKCDCMKGGNMEHQMTEMPDKPMGIMLMLMEQMIEHNEAEMATRR